MKMNSAEKPPWGGFSALRIQCFCKDAGVLITYRLQMDSKMRKMREKHLQMQ